MSFIRHRRATSPNKFECRNVYSTNRIDFRDEIFSSLNWRSIEIGEPTEAEDIIDDLIRETTPKDTMEWVYNIFLNNTDNILLLCTLIHSLSHIEYELVYPQGPMMGLREKCISRILLGRTSPGS